MRSLTTTLIWIISLNVIYAQVPLGFSFQTIIRDGEGKGVKCRLNINYNYMRLTETDDITGSNIHAL